MSSTFTVIIPTYNRPEKLARALTSCLIQTVPAYEIIVVDNGENPETRTVVDSHLKSSGQNIKYVRSEKFAHRKALATGIEAASGDWLTLLDDDDFLVPERIERDQELISKISDDVLMIVQDFIRVDYENSIIWAHSMAHKKLGLYEAIVIEDFPPAAAVTFRTKSIQAYHSFHLKDGWMTEFDLYANICPHGGVSRSGHIGYIMDDTRTKGRVTGSDIKKHVQAIELHRERFRETRKHLPSELTSGIDQILDAQQAFFCAKVLSFKGFFGETQRYCRAHPKESLKGILSPLRGVITRLLPKLLPEMRGSKTYTIKQYGQLNPSLSQYVEDSIIAE